MSLAKIEQEVKNHRGSTYTVPKGLIDILQVIEALKEDELKNYNSIILDFIDQHKGTGVLELVERSNSYKQGARLSHHYTYSLYRDAEYNRYIVQFQVTLGGRDTYLEMSEPAILIYQDEETFSDVISSIGEVFDLGNDYFALVDIYSDFIPVENEHGEQVGTISDIEDHNPNDYR